MTTFKRSDPFPFEFEIHSTAREGAVSITDKHGRHVEPRKKRSTKPKHGGK